MSFIVTYAGETNEDHNILAYCRPDIPAAEENVTEHEIPGRESNLTERNGNYGNTEVTITFNYAADTAEKWGELFRDAVMWLRKKGDLILSDDEKIFRKVLYVRIGTDTRTLKRIGKFDAVFVCKPGEYFVDGAEADSGSAIAQSTHYYINGVETSTVSNNVTSVRYDIQNDYSECRPVYTLTGNGSCELIVNGKTMTAAVDTSLTIDTDLKIAYQDNDTLCNTSVEGDYDDLVFIQGENKVEFTYGFTLTIQPNWRVL